MSETDNTLNPNELAFIALTNEFCQVIEQTGEATREQMLESMLKLLPRIYISASDLPKEAFVDAYINPSLDEQHYEMVRQAIAALMAADDTYLEVFLDDMKYSDKPIIATVSENLADLYQEFYDLVSAVEYATNDDQRHLLAQCREHFVEYWGQTLCNVMRALHSIACEPTTD